MRGGIFGAALMAVAATIAGLPAAHFAVKLYETPQAGGGFPKKVGYFLNLFAYSSAEIGHAIAVLGRGGASRPSPDYVLFCNTRAFDPVMGKPRYRLHPDVRAGYQMLLDKVNAQIADPYSSIQVMLAHNLYVVVRFPHLPHDRAILDIDVYRDPAGQRCTDYWAESMEMPVADFQAGRALFTTPLRRRQAE